MGTTFDGYIYLDLADVLGSPRFPGDWHFARTPLFPLALKGSLALLGRNPYSVLLLLAVIGLATALILGATARRLAGPLAGALVVLLIAWYPTWISYQHLVLTEIGTGFFIASIAALTL